MVADKRREEKRRPIPISIQLEVALRQLAKLMGCDPSDLQCDHDPALNWRDWNEAHSDCIPPANDPEHLVFRVAKGDHDQKTFGPGGEKRITTRGSDISEPRRLDRISDKTKEFQRRMGMSPTERKAEHKSKWPSRPFNGGQKRWQKKAKNPRQ